MRNFSVLTMFASLLVATFTTLLAWESADFAVQDSRDLVVVPKGGVRRALLISVGRHMSDKITPLGGVDSDVDLIRESLLDPHCGFQDDDVKVLKTNDYPSLEKINDALDDFFNSCGSNDFVFLYFGGHGFSDPKTKVDYFVPFDAKPILEDDRIVAIDSSSCFSLDVLRDKIGNCPAKFKWVVVDACRTNIESRAFGDDWNLIGNLEAVEGSLWFQSCKPNQKSYEISFSEEGKVVVHGVFTWFFCKGAKGEAANEDGLVSPIGLFNFTKREMKKLHETNRNVPEQTPLYSCQDFSDAGFVFVDVSDAARVRAEEAYKQARDFFFDEKYDQAKEKITEALKYVSNEPDHKKLREDIEKLKEKIDVFTRPIPPRKPSGGSENKPNVVASSNWSGDFSQTKPGARAVLTYKGVEFAFRYCPPGKITTSSPSEFKGKREYVPPHTVEAEEGFWIAETEITQEQWDVVAEQEQEPYRAPGFKGPKRPVVTLSYQDCQKFLDVINARVKVPEGWVFDLPLAEQWQYACNVGVSGSTKISSLKEYAWFQENSGRTTHDVGKKKANAWGIYDMLGNVSEWTKTRGSSGAKYVYCGGGYDSKALLCCSSSASSAFASPSQMGMRLVLAPSSSR